MSSASIWFVRLALANRLANHRLHKACQSLQPGEWEAPRSGFFPSLKKTLNHILVIDWFYVDALEGGTLGPAAWAIEEPCETVSELAVEQAAVDARLVTFCERLGSQEAEVRLIRQSRTERAPAGDVLMHLFLHQVHHRGQAHAMLSGTSVAPPQLDEFVLRGDARFRESDLAELGLSESRLMGDAGRSLGPRAVFTWLGSF